jgi:hypothetical protein
MLFHLEKKNQEIMAALQYKPSESHQRVIRESSEREREAEWPDIFHEN